MRSENNQTGGISQISDTGFTGDQTVYKLVLYPLP